LGGNFDAEEWECKIVLQRGVRRGRREEGFEEKYKRGEFEE